MKQQIFIIIFINLLAFKAALPMENDQKRRKNNGEQEKSIVLRLTFSNAHFVKDYASTQDADDTSLNGYNHRVDCKSLMLLIREAHQQSPTDAKEILRKIKTKCINLSEKDFAHVTAKDLNHRLLSHICAFGKEISRRDRLSNPRNGSPLGAQQIPVIINGKPAYLNYPDPQDLLDVVRDRQITSLEDFTDEKEITSLSYSDCYKAVEDLLKDIK
jgi:hypothetical protein